MPKKFRNKQSAGISYNNTVTRFTLPIIEGMARMGYSNAEIADQLGVQRLTFNKWMQEKEELAVAVNNARGIVEVMVENALLKRALGYDYIERTGERRCVGQEDNGEKVYKLVTTKKVKKHVQADVGAAKYWLENRLPQRWSSQQSDTIDEETAQSRLKSIAELLMNPVENRIVDEGADDDINE